MLLVGTPDAPGADMPLPPLSDSVVVRAEEFTEVAAGFPNLMFSGGDWGDYDNDGDLDLLLTGTDGRFTSDYYSKLYRNDGAGMFTEIASPFAAPVSGSVYAPPVGLWGDYDNDGFLDVLLANPTASRIFHNNRDGTFTDIQAGLTPVDDTAAAWVDYDNDGDLDVVLSGFGSLTGITKLYRNEGGHVFSNVVTTLPRLRYGAYAWGDFDHDGDLDALLNGYLPNDSVVTRVYRNVGDGVFHDIVAGLSSVLGSPAWGDYDRDGNLDILVAGLLYRNNGNGIFSQTNAGLDLITHGTAAWGDYDNDGWPDVLLTGRFGNQAVARVYRNNGNGTFSNILAALPGVETGASAWGDYDNDGDLDLLLAGGSVWGAVRLVQNNAPIPNIAPLAPTNLSSTILSGGVVSLFWGSGGDSPPSAPSFLRYNLRIGTTPGGSEIMSPSSDVMSGRRRLAGYGNAGATNFWRVRVPPGQYYWSVQSIDAGRRRLGQKSELGS